MITSHFSIALLIGAAATAVSVGVAAPADATCDKQCQTIKNELKKTTASLESGKLTPHQTALVTTRVKSLTWWIMGYDQKTKQWYENNLPSGETVNGLVPGKVHPELNVDLDGHPVVSGVDPYLYKVKIPPPPVTP